MRFIWLFLLLAIACTPNIKIDSVMAAHEAGDVTVIIEGCGHQPIVGYTYCRKQEGSAVENVFWLYAPPVTCETHPCVFWKIFLPTGELALGGNFEQNQTKIQVSWADLLKTDKFDLGHRGFYPVVMTVKWIDNDKRERQTVVDGEIRLRVFKRGYIPLNNASADPNFAIEWVQDGRPMKVTTGGRAYVGN
jgi:hypothetical protein